MARIYVRAEQYLYETGLSASASTMYMSLSEEA